VGHARVGDDLVAHPGRAQRLRDVASMFWWDDLVFFANQDEQATGHPRGAGKRRLGAADRDVGGGQPAGVDDGDGGQVELGGGQVGDVTADAESDHADGCTAVCVELGDGRGDVA